MDAGNPCVRVPKEQNIMTMAEWCRSFCINMSIKVQGTESYASFQPKDREPPSPPLTILCPSNECRVFVTTGSQAPLVPSRLVVCQGSKQATTSRQQRIATQDCYVIIWHPTVRQGWDISCNFNANYFSIMSVQKRRDKVVMLLSC